MCRPSKMSKVDEKGSRKGEEIDKLREIEIGVSVRYEEKQETKNGLESREQRL